MMKPKLQGSNAMAESANISPKSTQKEDAEAGAAHGAPRKVLSSEDTCPRGGMNGPRGSPQQGQCS